MSEPRAPRPPSIPPPSRRTVLAGLAAMLPACTVANVAEMAGVPPTRPAAAGRAVAGWPDGPALRAAAGLPGQSGYALMDLGSGTVVEGEGVDTAFLPASVAKLPTALYALETLAPQHRFATRVLATGPVVDGRLEGDLILSGGGDPALDTDALGALAEGLVQGGLREVAGRVLVDGSALPCCPRIDPDQPEHVAYNPSVSGLNLNFNRVHLEWRQERGERMIALEARGARWSPPVSGIRISAAPRAAPLFTWEVLRGVEVWTVSAPALGQRGSRWLPVRDPVPYAGEVFARLAAAAGLRLPAPQAGTGMGTELARWESAPLDQTLRDMLRHSTNLTAEVLGLSASKARGATGPLAASGAAMVTWLEGFGGAAPGMAFANHSGLSTGTRMTPRQTVQILAAAETAGRGRLRPLLRPVELAAGPGETPLPQPATAAAKTGTLNFVRGLAGYLEGASGRRFAFAIYAADLAARDRTAADGDERPAGSRAWVGRARAQERALLRSWAARFTGA